MMRNDIGLAHGLLSRRELMHSTMRLVTSVPVWLVLAASVPVCLVLAACTGSSREAAIDSVSSEPPSCGTDHRLSGAGIGDFRVGAAVAEVRAKCNVVLDTALQFGAEAQPERRLAVAIASDTVHATIVDDRVWRIEVRSPAFRTVDSIGVGTTVRELKQQPVKYLGFGEGGPFVSLPEHCGLSLELEGVPGAPRTLDRVPLTARVGRVLVLGCDPAAPPSAGRGPS